LISLRETNVAAIRPSVPRLSNSLAFGSATGLNALPFSVVLALKFIVSEGNGMLYVSVPIVIVAVVNVRERLPPNFLTVPESVPIKGPLPEVGEVWSIVRVNVSEPLHGFGHAPKENVPKRRSFAGLALTFV